LFAWGLKNMHRIQWVLFCKGKCRHFADLKNMRNGMIGLDIFLSFSKATRKKVPTKICKEKKGETIGFYFILKLNPEQGGTTNCQLRYY